MKHLFKNKIKINEDNYWILIFKMLIVSLLLLFSNGLIFADNSYFSLIGYLLFLFSFVLMYLFNLNIFKCEKIQFKIIFRAFLIFLLMTFLIFLVNNISQYMNIDIGSQEKYISTLSVKSIISIIIISPIIEEIIFRAFLIIGVFKHFQTLGFIFSSLCFSFFHSPSNVFIFLIYLIIGLCLGISLGLSRRLEIPILIHCCYNFSVIFLF